MPRIDTLTDGQRENGIPQHNQRAFGGVIVGMNPKIPIIWIPQMRGTVSNEYAFPSIHKGAGSKIINNTTHVILELYNTGKWPDNVPINMLRPTCIHV